MVLVGVVLVFTVGAVCTVAVGCAEDIVEACAVVSLTDVVVAVFATVAVLLDIAVNGGADVVVAVAVALAVLVLGSVPVLGTGSVTGVSPVVACVPVAGCGCTDARWPRELPRWHGQRGPPAAFHLLWRTWRAGVSHLLDRLRAGDMVVFHPVLGFDFVGMEGSQVTRLRLGFGPAGLLALACCVLGVASWNWFSLLRAALAETLRGVIGRPSGSGVSCSSSRCLTVPRVHAPLFLQLRECGGFRVLWMQRIGILLCDTASEARGNRITGSQGDQPYV